MVSTHKKKQSNRRLMIQLDDFERDLIIVNTASERPENNVVDEGTNDHDFNVGTSSDNLVTNENMVNVKTLERCFNEKIDKETSNTLDTVEERIQNVILTAIDSIVALKIELAIKSKKASSGWYATSVTLNSGGGEDAGINAFFWKRIWKQQYTTCIKPK